MRASPRAVFPSSWDNVRLSRVHGPDQPVVARRITGGDFARDYDDTVLGLAAHFVWANRNKESIALDLKHR
jgi:hypothetical protein